MTDSSVAPSSTMASPAPVAPAALAGQSPLDILEDILKQKNSANGNGSPSTAGEAAPAQPPAPTAEEVEVLEVERAAQDKVALAQKEAEMAALVHSPAAQAQEAQDQAKEAAAVTQAAAQDGFEINQLDHTKIAEDSAPT